MLFTSVEFLLFFVFVVAAYFLLPPRYRWILLLLSSAYFYMQFIPAYILVLGFLFVVDYAGGLLMGRVPDKQRRKPIFIASLLANLGVLVLFKYFNFLNANLSALFHLVGWNYDAPFLTLILPIGLSFQTFQSLSYLIEVYLGHQQAERHAGMMALYVMFFPTLVSGPIQRPQTLLPQFRQEHFFDYQRVTDGLKLMAWGLFKKVIIADRLAQIVNQVYDQPHSFTGVQFILATLCFAYQLYCDFSGYSDIAIGAAQVLGFRLMDNFKQPYASRSVPEFWRRWHISLSFWFRDYVFMLLGTRGAKWRREFNLFVTFLLSGLWHGAGWTFTIWGALHGIFILITMRTEALRDRIARAIRLDRVLRLREFLQIVATFTLVSFTWIFFRASNLPDALYIIGHLFDGLGSLVAHLTDLTAIKAIVAPLGFSKQEWLLIFAAIALLEIVQYFQRRGSVRQMLARQPVWLRWAIYYGWIAIILFLGVFNRSQFIYFRF